MLRRLFVGKYVITVLLYFLIIRQCNSQIMHYGLKGGIQMSSVWSDESQFLDQVKIHPVIGYNVGAVFSFRVKERYFLHTEYLYSVKGKRNTGRVDPELEDRVTYNYIEVPVMYNVFFKARLNTKHVRHFKWFAGIGPNFSYWLGGHGKVFADHFIEDQIPALEYKLKFGKRSENDGRADVVYVDDAKRFQLGLNFGGGILLEPINNRKIMIDLRLEVGHTWLGKAESADYVIPVNYDDNLKARNIGLKLSFLYMFESNLDKKVVNKGKSNLKHR